MPRLLTGLLIIVIAILGVTLRTSLYRKISPKIERVFLLGLIAIIIGVNIYIFIIQK